MKKARYKIADNIEPVPYEVIEDAPQQITEFPSLIPIPDDYIREERGGSSAPAQEPAQEEQESSLQAEPTQADRAHAGEGEILQAETIEEALPIWIRATQKKRIPSAFHTPRYKQQQSSSIERSLFDALKDLEKTGGQIEHKTKDATIQISPSEISELTMTRIDFALSQILYNTSFQYGTQRENTGLIKDGQTIEGELPPTLPGVKGNNYQSGEIAFSLADITALAFGITDKSKVYNIQKQEIKGALAALDKMKVSITYPNGDVLTQKLFIIAEEYYRKEDGALFYHAFLNPIYTMQLKGGTAAYPQNIMQRLANATGKMTAAKLRLTKILAAQKLSVPFVRYKEELLSELEMLEDYRKDKKRANNKLEALFQNMREIGLLLPSAPGGGENPVIDTGASGELRYTFHLNPEFVKTQKTEQNEEEEA